MSLAMNEERYTPATRVYQHTRSSVVNAPIELPNIGTDDKKNPEKVKRTRKGLSTATIAKMAGVSMLAFVAAITLLIIGGYSRVDQQYAKVNDMKKKIAASENRIAELEVELECAISIDDAIKAAKDAGMIYPSASQVRYIE